MPTTPTRDLVRRYQDALNAGDFDALDDIIAPDIATPDILPGFGQGLEGVKAIARATAHAWPDFHVAIDDLVAEDDEAMARITMTGTAVNDFGTMLPGNGSSFRFTGAYYVRAREGKLVEHVGVEDGLSLLRQLGLMP
jgi:predicted ester cyclase